MATSPPTTHAASPGVLAARPNTFRRDVASAYLATAARVIAWAVVSAIVVRRLGLGAFAVLALIRATVGLLTYTALGIGPAMIKFLADADRPVRAASLVGSADVSESRPTSSPTASPTLGYADLTLIKTDERAVTPFARVCDSGSSLAAAAAVFGLVVALLYGSTADALHHLTYQDAANANHLALLMGVGMVLRLLSEPAGGIVQVRGHIVLDNVLLVASEIAWMALAAVLITDDRHTLRGAGQAFALSSTLLLVLRRIAAGYAAPEVAGQRGRRDTAVARRMLLFGLGVVVAQSADFLYAPTDFILIKALLNTDALATYAPAVQIDGGLLLIVTGLAGVLLPRAALAHAAGDAAAVRAYYVHGTLASLALLTLAAGAVWLLAPALLRLWLGEDLPATRAILPLVLIHTVVGGTGAVGRSVLLAMGKVKPFAGSVLLAGAGNVILSFAFVRYFHLGLRGIIYGTIVVVVLRCAVWMPWYVMRTLKTQPKAAGDV